MALGAGGGGILALVLRRGIRLALWGVGLALAAVALAALRAVRISPVTALRSA